MLKSFTLRTKLFMVIGVPMLVLGAVAVAAFLGAKNSADSAASQVEAVEEALAIEQLAATMRAELGTSINGGADDATLASAREATDAGFEQILVFMEGTDRDKLETVRAELIRTREVFGNNPGNVWNALSNEILGLAPEVPRTLWGTQTFQRLISETVELDRLRGDAFPNGDTALDIALLKQMALWEDSLLAERNAFQLYLQPGVSESAERRGLLGPNAAATQAQNQFVSLAPDARRGIALRLTNQSDVLSLDRARVITRSGSTLTRAKLDANEILPSTDRILNSISLEHIQLEEQIIASANQVAADASTRQRNVLLGSVALLALVSLIALAMTRSITGPIRALTRRSRQIATEDLPATVYLFRSQGADAEAVALNPLEAQTNDELGELVEAFNELHATAIDLASEQAASRRVASEMFVNLGHRNQRLLSLALEDMDELEREENDPARLAKLFSVDQKITRMRRNAESLLVLAGTRTPRQWAQPAPIADVIRAAMAEVEDFERVIVKTDENVMVKGAVVADLTHLLAELIENALRFSPPSTAVEVGTRVTPTESLVYILDNGFGLSTEDRDEANARISDAAIDDETPSKRLGHYVVGRLGSRHGISVQLREESVSGGTVARVVLGAAVEGNADAVEEAPTASGADSNETISAEDPDSKSHTDAPNPEPQEQQETLAEMERQLATPVQATTPASDMEAMPATLAEALPEANFESLPDLDATAPRRVPGQTFGSARAAARPDLPAPAVSEAPAQVARPHRVPAMQPVDTETSRAPEQSAVEQPTAFEGPAQQPIPAPAPSPAPQSSLTPSTGLFPASPSTATPRRVPGANIPAALRSTNTPKTPRGPVETADPRASRDAFAGFQQSAKSASSEPARPAAEPSAEARPVPAPTQVAPTQAAPTQAPVQAAPAQPVRPLPPRPEPAHRRIPGENLPTPLRRQSESQAETWLFPQASESESESGSESESESLKDAFAGFQRSSTEATAHKTTEER